MKEKDFYGLDSEFSVLIDIGPRLEIPVLLAKWISVVSTQLV
jgi:hypothetical protein